MRDPITVTLFLVLYALAFYILGHTIGFVDGLSL